MNLNDQKSSLSALRHGNDVIDTLAAAGLGEIVTHATPWGLLRAVEMPLHLCTAAEVYLRNGKPLDGLIPHLRRSTFHVVR